MKKMIVLGSLGWILVTLLWSCQKVYTLGPLPLVPSPTPTPTPLCVNAPVTLPSLPVTWNGQVLNTIPPALGTPTTVFTGPFRYQTKAFVIRSYSDWQTFYGVASPPSPPVNFNTQMLIVLLYQNCFEQVSFQNTCEDQTQVSISILDIQPAFQCNAIAIPGDMVATAVPTSNFPISWQITVQ